MRPADHKVIQGRARGTQDFLKCMGTNVNKHDGNEAYSGVFLKFSATETQHNVNSVQCQLSATSAELHYKNYTESIR
jgi:hypothetical protein